MLRLKSLIAVLKRYKFLRKSLSGLRKDMPTVFEAMVKFYTENQSYELLEILINAEEKMDKKYMIWCKDGGLPLIIEYKEHYSKIEYEEISKKTGIPIETFEEIRLATYS